jgi:hypothetical protein
MDGSLTHRKSLVVCYRASVTHPTGVALWLVYLDSLLVENLRKTKQRRKSLTKFRNQIIEFWCPSNP